jgi:hypothetical protein
MSTNQQTDAESLIDLPEVDPAALEGMYREEATDDEVAEAMPDDPFPNDEDKFEKTYIAIDGIDVEDLSDAQIDAIEKEVTDSLLLSLGLPVSDVRVVSGDNYVVEHSAE